MDSKIGYLDRLYNNKGKFTVQYNFKGRFGERAWGKRIDWLEAREDDWVVDKVSHRSILQCEVVIDMDSKFPFLIKLWFKLLIWRLNKDVSQYKAYYTGSRGYHVHMVFYELLNYSPYQRRLIKQHIIGKYGGELLKASNSMIAIEHSKHWKTGKIKRMVKWKDKGWNHLKPFLEEMRK